MYCKKCGAWLEEDSRFCAACGADQTEGTAASNAAQFTPTIAQAPEMGMKWFKFLIYFALFASAVLNLISAVPILSGSMYEGQSELVYAYYDGLEGLDKFVGFAYIAVAVIAIVARFRLAGYCSDGPIYVYGLYAGAAVINLVYMIGINNILPEMIVSNVDFTTTIASIVTSIVMIGVNFIYFNKRKHLFTK